METKKIFGLVKVEKVTFEVLKHSSIFVATFVVVGSTLNALS